MSCDSAPEAPASWQDAEAALHGVVDRLHATGTDCPRWAEIAVAGAVLVSRLATAAEPAGAGPLSQVAALLRMLADLRPEGSGHGDGSAGELYQVARGFQPGIALPSPAQSRTLRSLIMRLTWLLITLAERDAQRRAPRTDDAGIAAARSAALALIPLAGIHTEAARRATSAAQSPHGLTLNASFAVPESSVRTDQPQR